MSHCPLFEGRTPGQSFGTRTAWRPWCIAAVRPFPERGPSESCGLCFTTPSSHRRAPATPSEQFLQVLGDLFFLCQTMPCRTLNLFAMGFRGILHPAFPSPCPHLFCGSPLLLGASRGPSHSREPRKPETFLPANTC